jgi:hypothetical protein
MPKRLSKRDSHVKDNLSEWDKAIEDAKKHIARLQAAFKDCEEKKAAGEPWPGDGKVA